MQDDQQVWEAAMPSTEADGEDAATGAELFFARVPVSHGEADVKTIFQTHGEVGPCWTVVWQCWNLCSMTNCVRSCAR